VKDPHEVLQQKQLELDRVRKEIESLKVVARLFSEGGLSDAPTPDPGQSSPTSLSDTISRLSDSVATNADNMFSSVAGPRSRFWDALRRAK
jgi:hypothetical protein